MRPAAERGLAWLAFLALVLLAVRLLLSGAGR